MTKTKADNIDAVPAYFPSTCLKKLERERKKIEKLIISIINCEF